MAWSGERIKEAASECFKYKPPLKWGKEDSFSVAMWLVARLFWVHRLIAPFQWAKFFLRAFFLKSAESHIPPSVGDLFALVPTALLVLNVAFLENGILWFVLPYWFLLGLCFWRILDIILVNVYYLMLRPMVEIKTPHNLYRSFILGCFNFFEVVLWIAMLWFFAGQHTGTPDIQFLSILGLVLKGDIGIAALASSHAALDIFCKVSFGIMLTVIVSRAVSLVPALPAEEAALKKSRGAVKPTNMQEKAVRK